MAATSSGWLLISSGIRTALRQRRPVVALESTVLTHGLPSDERLPVFRALEGAVREAGAEPAVVALMNGKACVGVQAREVEALTHAAGVAKCSRADLGWLLATKTPAGTTVSATLHIAAQAGLEVAATGGIGGVHREAGETFDVSADLIELARAPVALVCSGAKSIVDLRKTIEFLESQSVPVIGFGTEELPGFFTRATGLRLRATAATVEELAAAVRAYRASGWRGGLVVANPVPAEAALEPSEVEPLIEEACRRAAAQGVAGSALTPFLLAALSELSGGATLQANKALLRSNAALAARLAAALCPRRTRQR